MKVTAIVSAGVAAMALPAASAWQITLHGIDGRTGWMYGTGTQRCTNLAYSPPIAAQYSTFITEGHNVQRYKLWEGNGCTGVAWNLPPGTKTYSPLFNVRSYEVIN